MTRSNFPDLSDRSGFSHPVRSIVVTGELSAQRVKRWDGAAALCGDDRGGWAPLRKDSRGASRGSLSLSPRAGEQICVERAPLRAGRMFPAPGMQEEEGKKGVSFHLMLLLTAADKSGQTCASPSESEQRCRRPPLMSFPRRLSDVMQVLWGICSELYVVIIILWVGSLPDPTSCCIIITDRRAQFQRAWRKQLKQVCRTKHVMLGYSRQLKAAAISSTGLRNIGRNISSSLFLFAFDAPEETENQQEQPSICCFERWKRKTKM